MSRTKPQPDLKAADASVRLPVVEVVARLTDLLGARLVAYLAGVRESRTVRDWSTGARPIKARDVVEPRLRKALHIALFLREHEAPETVQAWFQGLNSQLDDRVPLTVLRDADPADPGPDEAAVLAAARDFIAR
jgi:hypothetical protein